MDTEKVVSTWTVGSPGLKSKMVLLQEMAGEMSDSESGDEDGWEELRAAGRDMHERDHGSWRHSLRLWQRALVRFPLWVLGAEPKFSARAASVGN